MATKTQEQIYNEYLANKKRSAYAAELYRFLDYKHAKRAKSVITEHDWRKQAYSSPDYAKTLIASTLPSIIISARNHNSHREQKTYQEMYAAWLWVAGYEKLSLEILSGKYVFRMSAFVSKISDLIASGF